MLETDTLFGDELKALGMNTYVLGVKANWASRSWVIRNTAELILCCTSGTHSMLSIVPHRLLWNHVILHACTLTFRHQI